MMQSDKSRQEILERIKKMSTIVDTAPLNTRYENEAIYRPVLPDAITCFKTELEAISGQCFVCESELDFAEKLIEFLRTINVQEVYCRDRIVANRLSEVGIKITSDMEGGFGQMQAGVTSCEFLVARTGSVVVSAAGLSGRQMNVFPPVHIVIANVSQLVLYPQDALLAMEDKYKNRMPSTITTITGPSRTADIEKTLVLGAHGPKELAVFILKK
ncbi:MAG: lactate utilization protein [Paludibacter sp.]|nr:lactate utilization protein [Paludibacter sp.]